MGSKRPTIPKATKEAVLKEFSSMCAICEGADPHIHHIDENPDNNERINLIPLCANCHLSGQHHVSRRIDSGILGLYRKWKVPGFLSPQFEVMWNRLSPFYDSDSKYEDLREALNELAQFIKGLNQGEYFAKKVAGMIPSRIGFGVLALGSETEWERRERERREEERRRQEEEEDLKYVLERRDDLEGLVAEVVRFQDWKRDESKKAGARPAV